MNTRQLVDEYNRLASTRNVPPLKGWKESRMKLFELVSILRTVRPQPVAATPLPVQRRQRGTPMRHVIVEALMVISHYEVRDTGEVLSLRTAKKRDRKTLLSVGLSYPDVLERVKAKYPGCKTTMGALRVAAIRARNGLDGYDTYQLPQKRPHGTKGRKGNTY